MVERRLAGVVVIAGLLFTSGPSWAQTPAVEQVAPSVLPPTIPIFPLPDVLVFPNVDLPLHIFEPRYRAMVSDALRGDRIIGMVLLQPGYESNYEGRPPVYTVGCAGVITDVEALPDGRFNIVLRGLVKFRVTGEDESRPYRLAHVDALPELWQEDERDALRAAREQLEAMVAPSEPSAGGPRFPPDVPDQDLINTLAQYLPLDPVDRQGLLEQTDPLARARVLIALLQRIGALH